MGYGYITAAAIYGQCYRCSQADASGFRQHGPVPVSTADSLHPTACWLIHAVGWSEYEYVSASVFLILRRGWSWWMHVLTGDGQIERNTLACDCVTGVAARASIPRPMGWSHQPWATVAGALAPGDCACSLHCTPTSPSWQFLFTYNSSRPCMVDCYSEHYPFSCSSHRFTVRRADRHLAMRRHSWSALYIASHGKKMALFNQCLAISKTVQDTAIVTTTEDK